jgi:ribosome biogenesis GTPase
VVDRFLVALEYGGVVPVLCLNKTDLIAGDPGETASVAAALAPYRELGIPVFETSAETGAGIEALRTALVGRTVAFVGHSGVGKSALLNALDPGGARAVGAGRSFDGKGRHTTRGARLALLPDGTRLIDTAGVREFGLWGISADELRAYFPEFTDRADACRFRSGCTHVHEPGCAVQAAVAAGEVSPARYAAYLRMLE